MEIILLLIIWAIGACITGAIGTYFDPELGLPMSDAIYIVNIFFTALFWPFALFIFILSLPIILGMSFGVILKRLIKFPVKEEI